MSSYRDLASAAKGLLGECVKTLAPTKEEYIIIGGWSPLLLNSSPIQPRVTFDVDLLFREGKKEGELEEIMRHFLENGFILSAKHHFQLLKVLNIAGQDFVYNVDFLHASDNDGKDDMFVHHLKLPIPIDEYKDETYMELSIKAPNSEILFHEKLFVKHREKFRLADGSDAEIEFPLMNEQGLLITKADSVNQPKRRHDSFDIYLAIKQARDPAEFVNWFKELKLRNGDLFNTLYGIKYAYEKNDMVTNIMRHLPGGFTREKMEAVRNDISNFFDKIGLSEKAKHHYKVVKEVAE